ncbi:hypothetical protein A2524_02745 [Candidatus Wolfebacteria bacterium RIFOXYD12_FULL_48_21]|uniref:HicB-like antitoxin of toxin-antitoxin system domain-containing protein n=1 Tax=Candidatus Wolfebacteria bacterium RIFOXYD1_FULL_48_65 TaxID=1802561 RepID=A0A1F8E3L1_9BACT|nr:MAG: hypothetical protein A2524_02745 [Candidatus Wolfebacteria bacterium RIFOXYD12_FULL_48_21]OGM95404.1 MAG: hypothetical protein A2610_00785 [Candidatus Wolfebacteria bacterium RIFOXYD1_FULL_48_65]OGM95785.1 MAG: hypothetical protein A2532_00175 [Candidatus Wolfebacteria bacterium RIFOXYD2_FULL_48_11]
MKKVNLQMQLPVSILREGKLFVAYTPALDLSTAGKTHAEAQKRFQEAVEIFFAEISKRGTVDEVLGELGWQKVKTKWIPPVVVSHQSQTIELSYV